jgi:hypothetical protein
MSHIFKVKTLINDEPRFVFITLDSLPETCHSDETVKDCLERHMRRSDQVDDYQGPPAKVLMYREFTTKRQIGITTIRVVKRYRQYGGPEEGGWYYDDDHLVREFTVPSSKAERLRQRLFKYAKAANEGCRSWDYKGKVHVLTGKYKVPPRPHYC